MPDGVARDSKYLTLGEPPQGHVYLPFAQQPRRAMAVLVRSPFGPSTGTFSMCAFSGPCIRWQLVQVASPRWKQPDIVSACGRLKRFGRPSGQKSPCGSLSGIGWLMKDSRGQPRLL